jgi:hypothetical protein
MTRNCRDFFVSENKQKNEKKQKCTQKTFKKSSRHPIYFFVKKSSTNFLPPCIFFVEKGLNALPFCQVAIFLGCIFQQKRTLLNTKISNLPTEQI